MIDKIQLFYYIRDMTKEEFIRKYGEEAWARKNDQSRLWHEQNREYHNGYKRNTEKTERKKGSTAFCRVHYELIENYELAKTDNFDFNKWHLHHRLENYWSHKKLKKKKLYYNLNPEALIWLPEKEHQNDAIMSAYHPEKTKWHKRIYEKED